jgi:hypothetical protein
MESDNTLTIKYTLGENDFLAHQLYDASTSNRIRMKRLRSRVIWPLVYFAMGGVFLLDDRFLPFLFLAALGILWYLLYPLWERRYYKQHYHSFIRENYRNKFGKPVTLLFSNGCIFAKEDGVESRVMTTELLEVVEIPTLILLKLKTGGSFLLPKKTIDDLDVLRSRLKFMADELEILYYEKPDWVWR